MFIFIVFEPFSASEKVQKISHFFKTHYFQLFQAPGTFWRDRAANFECDWFNGELLGWSGARVMKVFLFTPFLSMLWP